MAAALRLRLSTDLYVVSHNTEIRFVLSIVYAR